MKNASGKCSRALAGIGAAFVLLFALSACHTVEGIGKDIKAGGNAIEDKAEKNTSY